MKRIAVLAMLTLAACDPAPDRDRPPASESAAQERSGALPRPSASAASTPTPRNELVAERLVLAEWAKADNRERCAPVAFADDGGKGGTPRRANFSGGWAVAFDLPDERSAYGVAGTGKLPDDDASHAEQRRKLIAQWPLFRDLSGLPQPAFAGYGVEGATAYPADDPQGLDANSLAYVRIGGQSCLYNVWSRLGRAHLELLLDNLRIVEPAAD